jgi:hypothetical protein
MCSAKKGTMQIILLVKIARVRDIDRRPVGVASL